MRLLSYFVYSTETIAYFCHLFREPNVNYSFVRQSIGQIVRDTQNIYSLGCDTNIKVYQPVREYASFSYSPPLVASGNHLNKLNNLATSFTDKIDGKTFIDHLSGYIDRLVDEKDYQVIDHSYCDILEIACYMLDIQKIIEYTILGKLDDDFDNLDDFLEDLNNNTFDQEDTDQEDTDQEDTDQEDTDQEDTDREDTDREPTDREDTDREPTDQEDTDQEDTDREPTDDELKEIEETFFM